MRGMARKTRQNETAFEWHEKRLQALQLLAEGALSDEEISARVGVGRATLSRWKTTPAFRAKLIERVAELEEKILEAGVARRANRVRALDDRWRRMLRVIDERAASQEMANVAGGTTGLIVRDIKGVGKGDDFQLINLYSVDVGLLKELREVEKQAAQELGQWTEKRELSGSLSIGAKAEELTDDELAAVARGNQSG